MKFHIIHKEAVSLELKTQTSVNETLSKQSENEINGLKDAQKLLYFLIKHSLPHTTLFKPLVELCIELGATNLSFLKKEKNASYTGYSIVDEFLSCQAEVVENKIQTEIKSSQSYGLMLDEYTDISCRKHLALVGKYIFNGQPKLAFLQDIQIANGTSDTIYNSVKQFLNEQSGIQISKMSSFASDGPSVMLGKKNGVVKQLKQENETVVSLHCMNHRLQLAVSKTFTSIRKIESTDELLKGLFKYYHYSTVKTASLDAIQNLLRSMDELENSKNLVVNKPVHTRWLSHEKSFQTVRKLYPAIIQDLENAVAEGRDKYIREGSGIPATSLLKLMKSFEKLYFVHFLCDVCSTVASLTRYFEKEDIDLSVVEPKLNATISILQQMKLKDGFYLKQVDAVAERLNLVKTNSSDLDKIKNEFLECLVTNIKIRLENPEIISHLSVLNFNNCFDHFCYGEQEVVALAEHFQLDECDTLREWTELKDIFNGEKEKCTTRYLLSTLTEKKPTLGSAFPNMMQLLCVAETLICSTSAVERIFSKVQLTVTLHRNRLNVKTVNNILMVGTNTNSVEDLDVDKCVKNFLQKKRRICQN